MKISSWSFFAIALGFALGSATLARPKAAAAVPAQTPQNGTPAPSKPPAPKPQGNADEPENDATLFLTDDQKARIKAIREDADQQVLAAENDATLTPEQRVRKQKQIRKATRAQVFAVLSPDQQKTWSAEQREKREAKSSPPPKTH